PSSRSLATRTRPPTGTFTSRVSGGCILSVTLSVGSRAGRPPGRAGGSGRQVERRRRRRSQGDRGLLPGGQDLPAPRGVPGRRAGQGPVPPRRGRLGLA